MILYLKYRCYRSPNICKDGVTDVFVVGCRDHQNTHVRTIIYSMIVYLNSLLRHPCLYTIPIYMDSALPLDLIRVGIYHPCNLDQWTEV